MLLIFPYQPALAVVPILIGPLQVLLSFLPAILIAGGGALLAFFKPSSIRLATLLVAAMVASLCYGIPKLTRAFSHSHVATYSAGSTWPMFRGGVTRRGGGMDGAVDPTTDGRVWAFASRFKTYDSSPAIYGNRILAAAAETGDGQDHGAIVCLDAANGALIWEFSPSDFRATASSPAAAGRYVVCGEGAHLTNDARIVCLSIESGQKLWEVRTSGNVESSPCIADGMAFCGAGADGVYGLKLDVAPGSTVTPVVWHLQGRDKVKYHCDAAVAASNGRVYFSSATVHVQDWNGVVCVDAATGKEIWHADAPFPVWGPPTLVGDRLFVGMGNGTRTERAEQTWERIQQEMSKRGAKQGALDAAAPNFNPGGELRALDANSGKTLWTRKLHQTLASAVAAVDDQLFFAARDGVCMCVTVDNELEAQWDAHEGIEASPAIGSNHVYVVTESGRLCALDRRNLLPVWQTRLGQGDLFVSSPAVGHGHVYVGTPENGLVCMGNSAEPNPEPLCWPGARGGAGKSGCVDGSFLPAKGAFAWRWPVDLPGGARGVLPVITPAAFLGGTLYVSVGGAERTGLVALSVGNRSSTKPPDVDKWFVSTAFPPGDAVAVTTSQVYFAEGQAGNPGRKFRCVAVETGAELWQVPIDIEASGAFTLNANRLFCFDFPGELSCIGTRGGRAGRKSWSVPVGRGIGLPCVVDGLVLAATAENGVVAVSVNSGRILWKQPSPQTPVSGPIANEDEAVIATADRLIGISLVNGAALWNLPCSPSTAPLVMDDERILCTQTNGEIVVVSWNGKVVLNIPGALPGQPPMLLSEKLFYCSQQGTLRTVGLSKAHLESRWLATAWLGTITTPPLLADGVVYFTTSEKGLICARPGKE